MRRILFLYTELAEYFLNCARTLHARSDVEVSIVRWPVNAEAPFEFRIPKGMKVYDRSEFDGESLKGFVRSLGPDLILTSGWIDKGYLQVVREWAGSVPTVLILDNQWKGNLRQQLARIWGRFRIRPIFSHAWVPGDEQYEYARKLGFPSDRILDAFYVADTERFQKVFEQRKEGSFPHRFIFLGRYVEHKGVMELWQAFRELKEEGRTEDWELWCCGTGELYPERPEFEGIRHLGFVQPEKVPEVMMESSVFVLPSRFEPWGVVVQEFAASGAPLLLSDAVGSATAFLEEGGSGTSFPAGDKEALKNRLRSFIGTEERELERMGERAHQLSKSPTPQEWSEKLLSILK